MKELNKYLDSVSLANDLIVVSLRAMKLINAPLIDIEPIEGTLRHAIHILDEVLDLCNGCSLENNQSSFRNTLPFDQNQKDTST